MSTDEKVGLAQTTIAEHGLAATLAVLELPKSTWYYHQNHKLSYAEKHAHLMPLLDEIAENHPDYGYRRTTAELQDTYGQSVNHKVVQRLHQLWDLVLRRQTHRPKPSGIRKAIVAAGPRINLVAGLETIKPFAVAYTDFTELVYAHGSQKAYLMPIIGHCSKVVFGWAVGERPNTQLALTAWERAKDIFQQLGINYAGMIVHHDQDPVYTSYAWTAQLLLEDQVQVSYSLDGAKGNTEMEAFFSRFKTENRSLLVEARTLEELRRVVTDRMNYFNKERRHSRLGYQAPLRALTMNKTNQQTSLRSH
jgi:putative transposase